MAFAVVHFLESRSWLLSGITLLLYLFVLAPQFSFLLFSLRNTAERKLKHLIKPVHDFLGNMKLNISNLKWVVLHEDLNIMYYPAGIYLVKVNNRNTRTSCEICSKLTIIKIPGIFIVNFKHISHLVLVFLLFILNM